MRNLVAGLGLLAVLAGCGGGNVYPDTDVIHMKAFTPKNTNVHRDNGIMVSGVLEYEGQGNLRETFQAYLEEMAGQGWKRVDDKIGATQATGTMTKDNRTCSIEMVSTTGPIKVTIKVEAGR